MGVFDDGKFTSTDSLAAAWADDVGRSQPLVKDEFRIIALKGQDAIAQAEGLGKNTTTFQKP